MVCVCVCALYEHKGGHLSTPTYDKLGRLQEGRVQHPVCWCHAHKMKRGATHRAETIKTTYDAADPAHPLLTQVTPESSIEARDRELGNVSF